MMPLLRSFAFNLAVSAVIAAVATGFAYLYLGFLGVALVGIAILFTSTQADLGRETLRGLVSMEAMTPAERRARRAEGDGLLRVWRLARMLGLVLAVVGFAGFCWLQIPH